MDSHWQTTVIDLGRIKENSRERFYFQGLDTMPTIKEIVPGCGCSNFRFDRKTLRLHIDFSVDRVPRHIPGEQNISKHIKVLYLDGTFESLNFIGKKVR